jgi:hypothetical protein
VWDVAGSSSEPTHSFRSHTSGVNKVKFSPASPALAASVAQDRRINFYDVNISRTAHSVQCSEQPTCIDFHPSGSLVAVGTDSGAVLFYDLRKDNSPSHRIEHAHPSRVVSLEYAHPRGASASRQHSRQSTPSRSTRVSQDFSASRLLSRTIDAKDVQRKPDYSAPPTPNSLFKTQGSKNRLSMTPVRRGSKNSKTPQVPDMSAVRSSLESVQREWHRDNTTNNNGNSISISADQQDAMFAKPAPRTVVGKPTYPSSSSSSSVSGVPLFTADSFRQDAQTPSDAHVHTHTDPQQQLQFDRFSSPPPPSSSSAPSSYSAAETPSTVLILSETAAQPPSSFTPAHATHATHTAHSTPAPQGDYVTREYMEELKKGMLASFKEVLADAVADLRVQMHRDVINLQMDMWDRFDQLQKKQ